MVKSSRTEMDSAKSSVGFKVDDYYHKELRRQFVEDRLRADGDFLIRDNADCTQMVVSVMSRGNLCHFQALRRISNSGLTLFSFGDREFDRFDKLVEYHYRSQVPMSDPNRTLLKNPIRAPKLLYHEDEIDVRERLGGGAFGEVFKVYIKAEDLEAAMKTLKGNVSEKDRLAFEKEMNMMKSMSHEHVVRLIGVVVPSTKGDNQIKILLELINKGSLDKLLRKGKVTERGKLKICLQVARGMQYLHHHHIIHRDLAVRNILVHFEKNGSITAKVSDFGLSHVDESGQGFELKASQRLPLKWLAPECFTVKKWSLASDVWSYGILMWEVFEDGKEPYTEEGDPRTMQELYAHISQAGHPRRPRIIRDDVWDLMLRLWAKEAEARPTMTEVALVLKQIYERFDGRRTENTSY